MASSKKRRGRRPKCPRLSRNVRARWTHEHGWRFRADAMIDRTRLYGRWRAHPDEAAKDVRAFRGRAEQLRDIADLLTLEQGMKLVLRMTEDRGGSPETVRHYKECFRTLYRHFGGDTPLHEIGARSIEAFRTARRSQLVYKCRCDERGRSCHHSGRPVSAQRIDKDIKALGRIFNVAIRTKRLPGSNPVQEIERSRQKHRESAFYTAEEVTEILASIRANRDRCPTADRFHNVLAFLFLTGARLGELAHLRARMIDLQGGTVRLPREGKTGERTLPMSEPLRLVSARLIRGLDSSDFVLHGTTPKQRMTNVKNNDFPRWRKKIPERLQRRFHAHTLRHSFKTHLEESQVPGHHSDRLTGHAGRTVSSRYVHATLLQLRRSMSVAFDHLTDLLLHGTRDDAEAAVS